MRKAFCLLAAYLCIFSQVAFSQQHDTIPEPAIANPDSILRIININPYFTVHVDSVITYKLEINKDQSKYYWFLRNSPVGLKINKDNGMLSFKAEKSFFLSGKLKYDVEYKVLVGVQSLADSKEKADTSFTIVFYNTDIISSKLKPSVSTTLSVEEGDTVSFRVQCENGSFPIEHITFFANTPLKNFTLVKNCDDDFTWMPPFDFVKETDSGRVKILYLSFVGVNKFQIRDTAIVKIIVKDALNYPLAQQDYNLTVRNVNSYILQLKYSFVQLDKRVKNVKTTRTTFDITGSTTALTGSILSSSADDKSKKVGQVLPSVGVSLVPIKEAVAPQKVFDQNQASLVRNSIKRLEYMLRDNTLIGERDPEIARKTNKLKEELKQTQIQLIDVPLEIANNMTEEELNEYFNSPKVIKKYRLKK
ncbi:MAG: hypothetical protein H7Y27_04105 [Gemmatimonadaceae bacterium]|nr:hypothetical protein [Chitinophagaceae bacterium]